MNIDEKDKIEVGFSRDGLIKRIDPSIQERERNSYPQVHHTRYLQSNPTYDTLDTREHDE